MFVISRYGIFEHNILALFLAAIFIGVQVRGCEIPEYHIAICLCGFLWLGGNVIFTDSTC
jgi:hypothetical protein